MAFGPYRIVVSGGSGETWYAGSYGSNTTTDAGQANFHTYFSYDPHNEPEPTQADELPADPPPWLKKLFGRAPGTRVKNREPRGKRRDRRRRKTMLAKHHRKIIRQIEKAKSKLAHSS